MSGYLERYRKQQRRINMLFQSWCPKHNYAWESGNTGTVCPKCYPEITGSGPTGIMWNQFKDQPGRYKDKCLSHFNELAKLISAENERQLAKWGIQEHTCFAWMAYLTEEVGELAQAINKNNEGQGSREDIIAEAIQVATLALKIAEMQLSSGE